MAHSAGSMVDAAAESASSETHEPRLQFRIHHLLWISVWCSLLLTAIRLGGIPFGYVLPLVAGWVVYQSATMWLGGKLVHTLADWRTRRQLACST